MERGGPRGKKAQCMLGKVANIALILLLNSYNIEVCSKNLWRNMSILTILNFPDPRLRKQSEPVQNVDGKIAKLVDDMFETMYKAPGIGLAAPQINAPLRIIVVDISEEKNQPLCLINPQITHKEGVLCTAEGCLSVPGFYEEVERAQKIKVSAINRAGEPFTMDAEDLLAVCIQHENDHLYGKLFVDYVSSLRRQRIRQKLEKDKRQKNSA